jgi:hypothetical protein
VRRLVTPTREDRAWVALPARLDPLYDAVRPLRILREWARRPDR